LSIAPVIPVSPLLADPVPADGSPVLLISESSPLPGPEPAPVPVALPVPDSVPPPLPVSVAELDWGSSVSESHKGSLLISAYCQAHVSNRP